MIIVISTAKKTVLLTIYLSKLDFRNIDMKVKPFCTPLRRQAAGVSIPEHESQPKKIGLVITGETGSNSIPSDPAFRGSSQSSKENMKPPKKPISNLALFMKHQESILRKKGLSNEEAKAKALEMWHNTTPTVKDKYQAMYTRNKKKYDADLIKYNEQTKKRKLASSKGEVSISKF